MNRKSFIHACGLACTGGSALLTLLQSCGTSKSISATYSNNQLVLPVSSFVTVKNGEPKYSRMLMVRHEKLDYPIALFRKNENEYKALLLRCTHQGSELNVYGDLISCSAHGSEFSNTGEVVQGPAEQPLKSYPVKVTSENLYISLT